MQMPPAFWHASAGTGLWPPVPLELPVLLVLVLLLLLLVVG
jgi:hypothetical protein